MPGWNSPTTYRTFSYAEPDILVPDVLAPDIFIIYPIAYGPANFAIAIATQFYGAITTE